MKPLQTKTLEKMYINAGISEDERSLLRKYLTCFSYLYGSVQIVDLWHIFEHYKENITKNKFYDFINITQREENEYMIVNLNEAYTGETSIETDDKLLVNKWLVRRYEWKFWHLHKLEEFRDERHGPFIPKKEELFKYDHDTFFESTSGKEMAAFISNLKASGFEKDEYTNIQNILLDINGASIKGKKLKDIVCYSAHERFDIKYYTKENIRNYLIEKNSVSCSKKVLDRIKRYVLIENLNEFEDSIRRILNYINYDFGVELSEHELEKFLKLYTALINSTNRWTLYGWSSEELMRNLPPAKGPIKLQMGPNIQKMIDSGEYNLEEIENFIREKNLNIEIAKPQESENSYEEILEENSKYLEEFRLFLEKRNYRESIIDKHIDRVEFYINDYLMWGIPKHAVEGCSLEVISFIEYRVNEKVLPPSVHNIDFFLASIRLFYEYMCEKKLITINQLDELEDDINKCKDEMIEDYYDKNPKEIDLYDVVEVIEEAHGYGEGYINIKTGEKEYVPEDTSLYDGDIDELYDKLDNPNWVRVPDVVDYEIMKSFAMGLKNQNQSTKLYEILHNKKAYRNFKAAIYEMNISDDYYDFYYSEIEKFAKEWLENNTDGYNSDNSMHS